MSDAFADEFGVIGSAAAEANKDYVLKTVQERHIHFIRMWFTDVLGQMKSFAITPSELETAFDEGMGFDGSSIEGLRALDRIRHDRSPRCEHLPGASLAPQGRRRRPHVLQHPHARAQALRW